MLVLCLYVMLCFGVVHKINHYQCKRLPFGLVSTPALFQNILQKVLNDILRTAYFVYNDDICT